MVSGLLLEKIDIDDSDDRSEDSVPKVSRKRRPGILIGNQSKRRRFALPLKKLVSPNLLPKAGQLYHAKRARATFSPPPIESDDSECLSECLADVPALHKGKMVCFRSDAKSLVPVFSVETLNTVVISLERRPERMDGCVERLRTHCPGLPFRYFRATDGKQELIHLADVLDEWDTSKNVVYCKKRSIRKGWDDLHTYHERQLPLSAGERGCAMSHIRAWHHCLAAAAGNVDVAAVGDSMAMERAVKNNTPLLVLEDDAAPTPEFVETLSRAMAALPSDAQLLYLGYSQAAEWRREVTPDLVEAEYVWTTVGYIIWPSTARFLLSQLPIDQPVDNWLAQLCADGALKSYCIRPKIIRQSDAWNVNSDVAHSDEIPFTEAKHAA